MSANLEKLPSEILVVVLDYLEANDIISVQRVSRRLLGVARDRSLWRYKCFEKAPSASTTGNKTNNLAALTGALGGLSLSDSQSTVNHDVHPSSSTGAAETRSHVSRRAQAVANWDLSDAAEKIDWYSEFVARNAPLSTQWAGEGSLLPEIRGAAVFSGASKVVSPLEDGSLCVWDISQSTDGRRVFRELGKTTPSVLFEDRAARGAPSRNKLCFTGVTECINLDSARDKAFIAVDRILNEFDLHTMQVISQHSYAWPITALSQETSYDHPLTVGTTWSLNLYDPRVPMRDRSRSPEDLLRSRPADPEDSIAFLRNYMKDPNTTNASTTLQPMPSTFESAPQNSTDRSIFNAHSSSGWPLSQWPRRGGRRDISDFARIEPSPLSILHKGCNEIFVAGRFPSILSYDRRYFPRLNHVIHSGARLSALTSCQYPPPGASPTLGANATLIACGEYGGRGSLELYSLPHLKQDGNSSSHEYGLTDIAGDLGSVDREHAMFRAFSDPEYPFSYKNRQEASSSKLLSVALQGTRIVFSDAEGGLKWVERDGRGLARKWNINSFELNANGASVQGEQVVRKMVPLTVPDAERNVRGDGDLLIWTGESIGIVTTNSLRYEDGLAEAFDEKVNLEDDEEKAKAYASQMRRALERQADERIWMARRLR